MAEATKNAVSIRPASTICEENGRVVLRVEMPGVGKNDIDVRIDGDTLTVAGHRQLPEDGTYLIQERRRGDFQATYTLDGRVDRNKVDAKMDQGILTVTLHLRDEVKPRKIKVKTA